MAKIYGPDWGKAIGAGIGVVRLCTRNGKWQGGTKCYEAIRDALKKLGKVTKTVGKRRCLTIGAQWALLGVLGTVFYCEVECYIKNW